MTTAYDFPNSPTAGDEFVAAGRVWLYYDGVWKVLAQTVSDGGFSDSSLNSSFVDDGGGA